MQRYHSLDVFRGATMALMIVVNNAGTWQYVFSPLRHADWHGSTLTDLVYPFFLFAVGNALAFVMPRLREAGAAAFWGKVVKRTALIFGIGLLLNWWPFVQWQEGSLVFRHWVNPDNPEQGIRILGVLQRIALAYFFAAILAYYFRPKPLVLLSVLMLIGYWLLCLVFGGADPYSLEGWFGTSIDRQVLGLAHIYKGEGVPFEPEGLMGTLPSVVQVVFGYLAGQYIRAQGAVDWLWPKLKPVSDPIYQMLAGLFTVAFIVYVAGMFWDLSFPINKKIWTSSFVLYTVGLALLMTGVLIWYIEILGKRNWLTRFFEVFGKNPLFIYIVSFALPGALRLIRFNDTTPLAWFYTEVCAKVPGPPEVGSLCFSLIFLAFCWGICYLLDRKGIYIRV